MIDRGSWLMLMLCSNTLQHYKDIPVTSMPYGQAMAIMALVEFLRRFV